MKYFLIICYVLLCFTDYVAWSDKFINSKYAKYYKSFVHAIETDGNFKPLHSKVLSHFHRHGVIHPSIIMWLGCNFDNCNAKTMLNHTRVCVKLNALERWFNNVYDISYVITPNWSDIGRHWKHKHLKQFNEIELRVCFVHAMIDNQSID